ncbi:MAG: DHH family phosphoesterase [Lachnospiraceae bacterium]|jgi:c-di-AMP phosphodiesterase-like protein|nr:DHH family phosphoesterase [Lachnospiraceae bacterium]MCI9599426.1 DHH family phosphoesterase [Lachnospiraceae bacterium]
MKKNVKLNGQLRLYVRWPLYLTLLLIGMNIWIYFISHEAGMVMAVFVAVYAVAAGILYVSNQPVLYTELVSFATHYGQIQKNLLKELILPYALLTEEGKIIWMNRRFMEITGKGREYSRNISTIIPELSRKLLPAGEQSHTSMEFRYGESDYRADMKLIRMDEDMKGAHLTSTVEFEGSLIALYLFDITEINHYIRENQEQRMAAGLVYIDNYDEALEDVEEVRSPLLVALIERKINKYFNAYDGIVRKLEKDRFFVIMKEKALAQIRENKFDLLQDIKTVNIGNELPITLSISIGSGGASYMDCMEYARSAMDLALARGGDQAVVKTKEQITYYGGKTQQVEKNTRVKARVKAQALREIIEAKDKVVVMGHRLTDADSFGAAVGIYRAAKALNKKAHIVVNEVTTSVRPMLEEFNAANSPETGIVINSSQAREMVDRSTAVVVVDTDRPSYTECEEILSMTPTVVVFDHHRRGNESISQAVLSYIEPNASSACEMVAEILQYFADNIRLKSGEADCMFGGMVIDTNNFMTKTGVRTFEAAAFLRRCGADVTRVRKMFRDDMAEYKARAESVRHAEVYRGFALSICPGKGLESPTIVGAQAANELLNIVGVRASIVLTEYNGKIYVSARSIDEVNVQVIMEKIGGGGHLNVAGAQLQCSVEEAMKIIRQTLDHMLEEGELE